MYCYTDLKPQLLTDEGHRKFLKIRDRVKDLLLFSTTVSMEAALREASGDSWLSIACVDRMVELGELREISQPGCPGQRRLFIRC